MKSGSRRWVEMLRAHIDKTPIPPSRAAQISIPRKLERLVLRCLEKKPADRPETALELYDVLNEVPLENQWTADRALEWWEKRERSKS